MRSTTRVVLVLGLLVPTAADAFTVRLANGDSLNGELVEETQEGVVVLEHPQLGRIEVTKEQRFSAPTQPPTPVGDAGALSQRKRSEPAEPGEESGTEPTATPDGSEPTEEPWYQPGNGLFGTPLLRGWASNFGLGLSGSAGGFEDTKLSLIFKTGLDAPGKKWIVDFNYFLNVTPKRELDTQTVSKNQANGLVRRDWLRPTGGSWPKLFGFIQSRYQYDEFQPWRHRLGGHLGPGYVLLSAAKPPRLGELDLSVRGGFGFSYSFGDTGRAQPEGMLGFNFAWRYGWSKISVDQDFFLDFSDTDNVRTNASLNWDVDLGDPGGLGFRFGLLYNFDTESVGKVNDGTFLSSLTYEF